MNRNSKYRKTLTACYLGFITQAIAANFAPLLFLTFHRTFQISLGKIALISTVFFFTQLLVDLFCAKYVDRIGYRRSVVVSEILSASGLIGLALLPNLLPDPYAGILISVMIYAIGSGLIEVLVSPIVEACPFDNKDKVMSLLHSFYCWGSVSVILLSTLFFAVFGIESWRILACIWALIPLYNTFNFLSCPIEMLTENGEGLSIRQLFTIPLFWVALVLMICSGALCLVCYLLSALAPFPLLSLAGCIVCGFSVGIMWPGTISIASGKIPLGGTAMFALLAMAGDLGGSIGPGVVGLVTQSVNDNLRAGMLAGSFFPAILILSVFLLRRKRAATE